MMSEIKVDTLTGKTTANDITVTVGASATQSLKKGLVVVYHMFDQRGSHLGSANTTGQSLNVSSISDDSTGNYTTNISNNVSDNEYAVQLTSHYNGLVGNKNNGRFGGPYAITTSSVGTSILSSNSAADDGLGTCIICGDLS